MTINKILQSKIGAFIIIVPFIKPASEITGDFDIVFDIFKLIAAVLIFFVFWCSKKTISEVVLIFMVIQLVYFASTVLHFGDIKSAVVQMVSNISMVLVSNWVGIPLSPFNGT
jgi:hypothetical protein